MSGTTGGGVTVPTVPVPVSMGGTGQTSSSAAFNAISPITTTGDLILGTGANTAGRLGIGTSGQVLASNGTTAVWQNSSGSGTVTSVGVSGGTTGLTTSGSPITGSGTITLSGTLAVANGGTGVTTSTGSGAIVLGTSPTLTTPVISGGTIDNSIIGGTTPAAATVISLKLPNASNPAQFVTEYVDASGVLTITNLSGSAVATLSQGGGFDIAGRIQIFGSGAANAVLVQGAANNGNVLIGVAAGSAGPNLGAVIGNIRGTGALMAQVPLSDYVLTAAVLAGGTGYSNGDTLTVVGGTGSSATVSVTVSGGIVNGVTIVNSGAYSVQPSLTPATTGGTGSGCTLTLTYAVTGNARGTNAVDWQTTRSAATQVASGASAFLMGGSGNTASGQGSIAGGENCTASAQDAAALGNACTASSLRSVAIGSGNIADAAYSQVRGQNGSAHGLYAADIFSGGRFAATGDAQAGTYVLRGRSTGGAAVRLTADGGSLGPGFTTPTTPGSANVINIPIKTNASGVLHISAIDTATWNSASWSIPLKMGCAATAGTMAIVAGTFDFANVVGAVAASGNAVLTADTTNRGVNITCTPPNSNTWDYVAVFRDSEAQ